MAVARGQTVQRRRNSGCDLDMTKEGKFESYSVKFNWTIGCDCPSCVYNREIVAKIKEIVEGTKE